MIESLNAMHAEYVKAIERSDAFLVERENKLDIREQVIEARERTYNDSALDKERQFSERVKTLENRENAVAQVRDVAARRKAEIETLKQEVSRLTQQASEARAAQRAAEEKARKIGEGIGFLKSLTPAI